MKRGEEMAARTVKRRTFIIVAIVTLALGFLVGQMIPLPVFDSINLRASMTRPGDVHQRTNW